MTAGRWLDASSHTARQALTDLYRHGVPAGDIPAVLYARDRAWRRLADLADLIRGTTPMAVSLSDARQLLTGPPTTPLRILAAAARAAPARAFGQPDHHPHANGVTARRLIDAADHIATLGDLLTTHLRPTPGQKSLRLYPQRRRGAHRGPTTGQLTTAGAAIARGVERDQVVGELATIARAWFAIDRVLADPHGLAAGHIAKPVLDHLHAWTRSPFGALFDDYAAIAPASGLRTLDTATDPARPAGPRPITSLDDVRRTVTDITNTLTRDPQQATAQLAAALARLGYIAHGARVQPDERARQQLVRWKELALELDKLRHLRDRQQPHLADEANRAAAWLRHQAVQPGPAPVDDNLRQAIVGALGQTVDPLRHALTSRELLTPTLHTMNTVRHGIRTAEMKWTPNTSRDATARKVLHQVADLTREHRADVDASAQHDHGHDQRPVEPAHDQAAADPPVVHTRMPVEARDPQPVERARHRTAELEL